MPSHSGKGIVQPGIRFLVPEAVELLRGALFGALSLCGCALLVCRSGLGALALRCLVGACLLDHKDDVGGGRNRARIPGV